jgi:Tfp pilus assembly protein PilP
MNTLRTILSGMLAVGAVGALAGCGDDGEQAMPLESVAQPRDQVVSDSTAPVEEPEEEAAPSRFDIDRRSFNVSSRDPFTPPMRRPGIDRNGPNEFIVDCDREVEPLGFTDPDNLSLEGLVTGTAVPRAMFYIPGNNTAIFVTEGAKVGPNCRNVIVDIRDNEVVIREDAAGDMGSETIIVLTDELITRAEVTEDP